MRKSPLPKPVSLSGLARETAKPKVVVVEADPDSRDMLKLVLEMEVGCQVLDFEDAEPAFALQDGARPAMIIVNIGFNDLVTVNRLRQHAAFRELPIIVTSANALPSFRNRAMSAGCDHFFTKPYDPYELTLALKPYLSDGQ